MRRKGPAPRRPLVADPVYNSPLVTQLINKILLRGKRSLAERVVYGALEGCKEKTGTDPVVTLKRALDNVKPSIEVKSRRVGGATYQVPMEVPPARQLALAMRWIVNYALARKNVPLVKALASELKEAAIGQGNAIKKRDDTHKMAQANRAFAHLRW